ncbi:YhbY family RNA-binding protein [Nibricoccus sp. IMCC34717]|uniref:YhbY family RNA-binding protein n=1 Tax=Nibricoccus sp. IMCC34717 TaxID=3034021 RepID=UPI0038515957
MENSRLTGSQKTFLRGLGQTREPALMVGRAGLTAEFFRELAHLIDTQELVKLRFVGADRHARAAFCEQIERDGHCACVGSVGHTALFYREQADPEKRRIVFAR